MTVFVFFSLSYLGKDVVQSAIDAFIQAVSDLTTLGKHNNYESSCVYLIKQYQNKK